MPRTLPWLTGGASKAQDAKDSPRRREVKQNAASDETPKATKAPSRSEKRDFFRSSNVQTTVRYLVEGFNNDDIYMMVEDEFYAMAQTFTQHLHYAEYVKRKKEAKLQNAAAIKDLARPTDGVTPISEETKRREAAAALSARQKAGLEKAEADRPLNGSEEGEEDTEDDDGLAGTSLGYLMTSPRKIRSLVGMQGIQSSTRAAAGYGRASGEQKQSAAGGNNVRTSPSKAAEKDEHAADETATEDDDLDGQTNGTPTRPRMPSTASSSKQSVSRTPTPQSTYVDVKEERQPVDVSYRTQPIPRTKKRVFFDDFDELPELSEITPTGGRFSSPSSNNTPKNQKEKVSNLKKSRLNEVPTFLL
ncbi:uncharacterized protein ACLA_074620 [Aspergillus clavatus NRRL 1]|uniref:Uncharacterized protein n=1 Tax=Aspergillus clavatus (strain ATCC 1007 / CBS 513.65 / DSM 816 / NCTC 3887 / NRRL 1 / QM 1276 / 107) TaxID=344612 RepID=A1C7Q4_ASPCL|nr:uncharacterized protein ACLA_074620 [Aspergillus clavatus NRRL 1]EAW14425.1 conserved hypothetical protein [Aspergillus clavatus NRRL 1]